MQSARWLIVGVLAALLGLLLAASPASAQAAGNPSARPLEGRLRTGRHSVLSSNWSGYAAHGATFTNAQGSWTQPAANCSSVRGHRYTFAAFWVGLDGYESPTVEQTGTEADCSGSEPVYYAWYELYPERLFLISEPVKPGDVLHAEVTQGVLRLQDATRKWIAEEQYLPGPLAFNSAEWIAEAVLHQPLTDFGSVHFEGARAASSEVKNGPIDDAAWSSDAITLVNNQGATLAQPGSLEAAGTAFTIGVTPEEGQPKGKGRGHGKRP